MTQDEALRILKTGANVFLTGEPGSGKTHTVNTYIRWLREHGIEPAITASTGIAATHIGGMTIHAWSGIGVKRYLTEYDREAIATNKRIAERMRSTHVLIIDEVSMLSGDTLAMVDQVIRAVRASEKPFGGMQVVLVGDFFQLPPIVRREDPGLYEDESTFAFQSRVWHELNPFVCYLGEQYRSDAELASVLGAIRRGINTLHEKLEERLVAEASLHEDMPRLFSHNADVDRINDARLSKMPGGAKVFSMTARGPAHIIESLKRGCLSPEQLVLKVGARVMFTKNDPMGRFVNGTLGEVIDLPRVEHPIVKTTDNTRVAVEPSEWSVTDGSTVLARIFQLPLRLAWAITVHKSQGMTLDAAAIDLGSAFEYGQGYVALSRVRSLEGLHLLGWNRRALEVHPEVLLHDEKFRAQSGDAVEAFLHINGSEYDELVEQFVRAAGGDPKGGVVPMPKEKKNRAAKKGSTLEATLELLRARKSIAAIAKERSLTQGTIISHLQELYVSERIDRADIEATISPSLARSLPKICAAFKRVGSGSLTPVHKELKGVYSFDDLKLARLLCS